MKNRINNTARLDVENLEARDVPATSILQNGVLTITGTNASETIRVVESGNYITVDSTRTFYKGNISRVQVNALAGNDTVEMRTLTKAATIYGGDGDDFIVGTKASDAIYAGNGNDRVFGMEGNDYMDGQAGNDKLFGMAGYDYHVGGDGDDFMDDGNRASNEYFFGGNGMDWNADIVSVGGTQMTDVIQQGAPTCSFLSSLSGFAKAGYNFNNWIRYSGFDGQGMPQYQVAFWKSGGWTWTTVQFNGDRTWNDTGVSTEGESWTVLMQRAWIKFKGGDGRAWPHEAMHALSGRSVSSQYTVYESDFNRISTALSQNKIVTAATNPSSNSAYLVNNHAYTVTAVWGSGSNRWVQVRNPWGTDGAAGYGANDGFVWVKWEDFKANMKYLAIA